MGYLAGVEELLGAGKTHMHLVVTSGEQSVEKETFFIYKGM